MIASFSVFIFWKKHMIFGNYNNWIVITKIESVFIIFLCAMSFNSFLNHTVWHTHNVSFRYFASIEYIVIIGFSWMPWDLTLDWVNWIYCVNRLFLDAMKFNLCLNRMNIENYSYNYQCWLQNHYISINKNIIFGSGILNSIICYSHNV